MSMGVEGPGGPGSIGGEGFGGDYVNPNEVALMKMLQGAIEIMFKGTQDTSLVSPMGLVSKDSPPRPQDWKVDPEYNKRS